MFTFKPPSSTAQSAPDGSAHVLPSTGTSLPALLGGHALDESRSCRTPPAPPGVAGASCGNGSRQIARSTPESRLPCIRDAGPTLPDRWEQTSDLCRPTPAEIDKRRRFQSPPDDQQSRECSTFPEPAYASRRFLGHRKPRQPGAWDLVPLLQSTS